MTDFKTQIINEFICIAHKINYKYKIDLCNNLKLLHNIFTGNFKIKLDEYNNYIENIYEELDYIPKSSLSNNDNIIVMILDNIFTNFKKNCTQITYIVNNLKKNISKNLKEQKKYNNDIKNIVENINADNFDDKLSDMKNILNTYNEKLLINISTIFDLFNYYNYINELYKNNIYTISSIVYELNLINKRKIVSENSSNKKIKIY